MKQTYRFFGEEELEFDDSKSVRELVQYAFEQFGYYEPFGMEIVTVFQCHHSKSNTGWLTTDVARSCAEEIENGDELFFAYHMPGVFYFAEGGWGHHMTGLGNHPCLADPVQIKLKFESFNNTVVFAGGITFRQIIDALKKTEYLSQSLSKMDVRVLDYPRSRYSYSIGFDDAIMDAPLTVFAEKLPDGIVTIVLE